MGAVAEKSQSTRIAELEHRVAELEREAAMLRDTERRKDEALLALVRELRGLLMPVFKELAVMNECEGFGPTAGQSIDRIVLQLGDLKRLADELRNIVPSPSRKAPTE